MNFKEKIEIDGYFYTILKNNRNKYKLVIDLLGLKGKFVDTPEKIYYINTLISEESSILSYLDTMTTQPDILKELLLHDFNIKDTKNFNTTEAKYVKVIMDILKEYSLESLNLDRTPLPIKLSNICSYIDNSMLKMNPQKPDFISGGIATINLDWKTEEELIYYKFMVSYLLHNPNLPEELILLKVLYNVPNLNYDPILPIAEGLAEELVVEEVVEEYLENIVKETTPEAYTTAYFQLFIERIYTCAECCIGSNSYEKMLLDTKVSTTASVILDELMSTKQYTVVKSSKSGGNEVPVKTFDDRTKAEEYISELTSNHPRVVEMFDLSIREN